jgi:hypothetical protein
MKVRIICIGSLLFSCFCNADEPLSERVRGSGSLSPSERIELLFEVERAGFNALDDDTLTQLFKDSLESQEDQVKAAAIGLMGMYAPFKPEIVDSAISEQMLVESIELGSSELAIEASKLGVILFEGVEDVGRAIANRISNSDVDQELQWQLLKLLPRFGEYLPQEIVMLGEIAATRIDASGKYAVVALGTKNLGNPTLTDSAFSIMESPRLFCDMKLLSMIGEALPVIRKHLVMLEEMDQVLREQSALPAKERSVSIYNEEFYRAKMDDAFVRVRAAVNR